MGRWLENGDKQFIGQVIFLLCVLIALAILFFSCYSVVPINIDKEIVENALVSPSYITGENK